MNSLILAVLCAAAPVGTSPALFENMNFAKEDFVKEVTDERLTRGGWPTLIFPSRGVVILADGERERFTFTAKPSGSGYTLLLKDEWGHMYTRSWQWLDTQRASTDLWGSSHVASRAHPTPWERREAFGHRLAAKELEPGEFRDSRGPVFTIRGDGGVTWSRPDLRGTFFTCQLTCTVGARQSLCVKFERPPSVDIFSSEREYIFESTDGGVVGTPVRQYDPCEAREHVSGDALRR